MHICGILSDNFLFVDPFVECRTKSLIRNYPENATITEDSSYALSCIYTLSYLLSINIMTMFVALS